jgi:hypothetical protein
MSEREERKEKEVSVNATMPVTSDKNWLTKVQLLAELKRTDARHLHDYAQSFIFYSECIIKIFRRLDIFFLNRVKV